MQVKRANVTRQCISVYFSAVQCSAVKCFAVHHNAVQCGAVQFSGMTALKVLLILSACDACVWVWVFFWLGSLYQFYYPLR